MGMDMQQPLKPETMPADPERASLEGKNKLIGFWMFLGGETALFASLFATYITLRNSNAGGPTAEELFSLPLAFLITMVLLTSSLTSVYAIHHMKNLEYKKFLLWMWITVALGVTFLALEIYEFNHYVSMGHSFGSSAFATGFYSLVGFHGAHVLFGVCWITALLIRNGRRPLTLYTAPKFYVASLYWHFIDVVWVFIFTAVYLMGRVG